MRKAIIGFSAVLISAFVIILAVNAQSGPQENKKTCTEVSKDGSKCPAASSCCKMKYGSVSEAKTCDHSKCKEKGCDQANCKEGKCDHESCKSACAATSCEAKKCDHAGAKAGSIN